MSARKLGIDEPKKLTTIVNLLLDSSSSMLSRMDSTVNALKEFIQRLQKESKDKDLDIILTIRTFCSNIQNNLVMETLVDNQLVRNIEPAVVNKYSPDGGTPLYDALGEYITNVSLKESTINMFVIQTDGQENTSQQYNKEKIELLIDEKKTKDNWQFVFLGVDFDAMEESQNIKIASGNTFSFKSTRSVPVYTAMASSIGNYATYRNSVTGSAAAKLTTDVFVNSYLKVAIDKQTTDTTSSNIIQSNNKSVSKTKKGKK